MTPDPTQTTESISDWQNAAQMIREAGYIHPAECLESLGEENERLKADVSHLKAVMEEMWRTTRATVREAIAELSADE